MLHSLIIIVIAVRGHPTSLLDLHLGSFWDRTVCYIDALEPRLTLLAPQESDHVLRQIGIRGLEDALVPVSVWMDHKRRQLSDLAFAKRFEDSWCALAADTWLMEFNFTQLRCHFHYLNYKLSEWVLGPLSEVAVRVGDLEILELFCSFTAPFSYLFDQVVLNFKVIWHIFKGQSS